MGLILSKLRSPAHDASSLAGKVYVVTGGAAGIGYQTTLQLALRGARVLVGARSAPRAAAALSLMALDHPSVEGLITVFKLDLDTLEGATSGAQEVTKITDRLDGVVNNAGRLASAGLGYEVGEQGLEMQMQVNHMGTFAFTMGLLPLLEKTSELVGSDVRIVTLSSVAHTFVPSSFSFSSPTALNDPLSTPSSLNSLKSRFKRYGLSKLCNILFTRELQRRLDEKDSSIVCIAVHPGAVSTSADRYPFPISTIIRTLFLTPSQGSLTSLFALTSPLVRAEATTYKGSYLVPFGATGELSELGKNKAEGRKLWDMSEKILADGGVKAQT